MMLSRFIRPLAGAAALIGLGAYAAIMLRGPQGVTALKQKQQEIRTLEDQNASLRRDIEKERDRIERLKTDPKTQEVELEKLGLVHKNDTQFKVSGQPKTDK